MIYPFTYTRRHPDTAHPFRATDGAAGLDLTADHDVTIPAGGSEWVCTGIAVALPSSHAGKLYVRSSLGAKQDVVLANGTGIIDSDYRGWIKAKLRNHSRGRITINRGERIVQLVVQQIVTDSPREVAELPATGRGDGGFGSTGAGSITTAEGKKPVKAPKTHNLNSATRQEVIRAGRDAAARGYSIRQCPWIKAWAAQHGPPGQDDPRVGEIFDLWLWAYGAGHETTN